MDHFERLVEQKMVLPVLRQEPKDTAEKRRKIHLGKLGLGDPAHQPAQFPILQRVHDYRQRGQQPLGDHLGIPALGEPVRGHRHQIQRAQLVHDDIGREKMPLDDGGEARSQLILLPRHQCGVRDRKAEGAPEQRGYREPVRQAADQRRFGAGLDKRNPEVLSRRGVGCDEQGRHHQQEAGSYRALSAKRLALPLLSTLCHMAFHGRVPRSGSLPSPVFRMPRAYVEFMRSVSVLLSALLLVAACSSGGGPPSPAADQPAPGWGGAVSPGGLSIDWRTAYLGDSVQVTIIDPRSYYRVQEVRLIAPDGRSYAASEITRDVLRGRSDDDWYGRPSLGVGGAVGSHGGGLGVGLSFPIGNRAADAERQGQTSTEARIRLSDPDFYRRTAADWTIEVGLADPSGAPHVARIAAPVPGS